MVRRLDGVALQLLARLTCHRFPHCGVHSKQRHCASQQSDISLLQDPALKFVSALLAAFEFWPSRNNSDTAYQRLLSNTTANALGDHADIKRRGPNHAFSLEDQ